MRLPGLKRTYPVIYVGSVFTYKKGDLSTRGQTKNENTNHVFVVYVEDLLKLL